MGRSAEGNDGGGLVCQRRVAKVGDASAMGKTTAVAFGISGKQDRNRRDGWRRGQGGRRRPVPGGPRKGQRERDVGPVGTSCRSARTGNRGREPGECGGRLGSRGGWLQSQGCGPTGIPSRQPAGPCHGGRGAAADGAETEGEGGALDQPTLDKVPGYRRRPREACSACPRVTMAYRRLFTALTAIARCCVRAGSSSCHRVLPLGRSP